MSKFVKKSKIDLSSDQQIKFVKPPVHRKKVKQVCGPSLKQHLIFDKTPYLSSDTQSLSVFRPQETLKSQLTFLQHSNRERRNVVFCTFNLNFRQFYYSIWKRYFENTSPMTVYFEHVQWAFTIPSTIFKIVLFQNF